MSVYDSSRLEVRTIFISYSSVDRVRTNGLGLLLEAMGHTVFHDHRTIKPGMKWEAALQEGLDEADAVMVFWTKHAARSDWVRKEYEYFCTRYADRPLVPVLGDETPLPEILQTRQHADFAPLVNEVLETKRRMKKEGASASEIQRAVVGRLDEAGIELRTRKQRRMLGLFLGFGWLFTLLRSPGASARTAGRSVVEKTAQMTVGQMAALGAAAVVGLAAGGPVADTLIRRGPTEGESIFVATPESTLPGEGETDARARDEGVLLSSELPAGYVGLSDTLWRFREGILESHDTINVRLARITAFLDDEFSGSAGVALAACREENASLKESLQRLEASLAGTGVSDETNVPRRQEPLPRPERVGGDQQIRYVPIEIGGAIVDPEPLDTPRPPYPQLAREQGIEGTVTVQAVIDEAGEVSVEDTDGPSILATAARRTVEEWRFTPGTRDGVPIPRRFEVKITFAFRR